MADRKRSTTAATFDDAIWRIISAERSPVATAAHLQSLGITSALAGTHELIRDVDLATLAQTAGLDPLDPGGDPIELDVLTWSLVSTLRAQGGMPLHGE